MFYSKQLALPYSHPTVMYVVTYYIKGKHLHQRDILGGNAMDCI